VTLGESPHWSDLAILVIGGLAIFLFGIRKLSDSLKLLAGHRLKLLIEKSTSTTFKALLIGVFVTVLLQTSTGTTALTVSLVRAGLMTFPQAVGVIIGANLGTTATSFIIGLQIEEYALLMVAAGVFAQLFSPSLRFQRIGGVVFGFGMVFFGLDLMGDSLSVFTEYDAFERMLITVSDIPVLGVAVGTVATISVQSSTAVIGILQRLYATGTLPLIGAVAIVLGSNIGTTVTAVLAAVGGSVAAKRTAAAHVLYNLGGSILFLILIVPYTAFIMMLQDIWLDGQTVPLTISFAHIFFNLFNTIVMFFLVKQLTALSKRMVRGTDQDVVLNVDSLQDSLLRKAPSLALENAKGVLDSMADIVQDMFRSSVTYSFTTDKKALERGRMLEEMVDTTDSKLYGYLVRLSESIEDPELADRQGTFFESIHDLERIGDHCQNLFDFFEERRERRLSLSEASAKKLRSLYAHVSDMLERTVRALKEEDLRAAESVLVDEELLDEKIRTARKEHLERSRRGQADELYIDILSNVERIGDHCENIARNLLALSRPR